MDDFFFDWVLKPLIIALIAVLFVLEWASSEDKQDLYKECITTDYDKFQCYSMIYGDE